MRVLYFLIACIMACTMFGCAQTVWMHREHSSQGRFEQDQRECQYDSVKYGQAQGYYQTGAVAGFADAMRKNEVFVACMHSKGYYVAEKKNVERISASNSEEYCSVSIEEISEEFQKRLKSNLIVSLYFIETGCKYKDIVVYMNSLWDEIEDTKRKELTDIANKIYATLCMEKNIKYNHYYISIITK